jgi:hypothetical protein
VLCVLPWNPPSKEITPPRPVRVLHSLIAASTPSAPVGPQKCTFNRSRICTGRVPKSRSVKSLGGEVEPLGVHVELRVRGGHESGVVVPQRQHARTGDEVEAVLEQFPADHVGGAV